MAQVMFVASPLDCSVNSTRLWISNGFRKSSLIETLEGGTEDLLRRRVDARRALDTEGVGLGRGIAENRGDRNDDDDGDGLEHRSLQWSVEITRIASGPGPQKLTMTLKPP